MDLLTNKYSIYLKVMFVFIEKMLIRSLTVCTIGSFGESLVSNAKKLIKCVPLNYHPSCARPTLANINCNNTFLHRFLVSVNKCGGSRNTYYDPYAQVFVPNKVKNMNVKMFNLMSEVNEARFLVQDE